MEKEFVTYELALRMKQLGFDEPCFMYWWKGENDYILTDLIEGEARTNDFKAPLFQQAFRWFREKYQLYHEITIYNTGVINYISKVTSSKGQYHIGIYKLYEEAELFCLEKLIDIVEGKSE